MPRLTPYDSKVTIPLVLPLESMTRCLVALASVSTVG